MTDHKDYVDAPNWLTIATQLTPGTTEDDRRINVDAVKMLDRLNSLSGTETLRDIIAIVDSATDADAGSSGIAPENKKRKSGNP